MDAAVKERVFRACASVTLAGVQRTAVQLRAPRTVLTMASAIMALASVTRASLVTLARQACAQRTAPIVACALMANAFARELSLASTAKNSWTATATAIRPPPEVDAFATMVLLAPLAKS